MYIFIFICIYIYVHDSKVYCYKTYNTVHRTIPTALDYSTAYQDT